jgi:hypothetical protein
MGRSDTQTLTQGTWGVTRGHWPDAAMGVEDCICCREAPGVDEQGYCGHCHWAVRAEVEQGLYQLREYLHAWVRFADWCARREAAG